MRAAKRNTIIVFLTSVACLFAGSFAPIAQAANCDEIVCTKDDIGGYPECNRRKQSCLEDRIREAQSASVTLKNTISIISGQLQLQQLQIDRTLAEISGLEKDITELTDRISGLSLSLDRLTTMLIERTRENYKRDRFTRLTQLVSIVTNQNLTDSVAQYKYLSLTQQQTASAMQRAETQRIVYDEQKQLKESKQKELQSKRTQLQQQQTQLGKQKTEQQYLLNETQSNEAKYQAELAKTLAELNAIQSIIAGKGTESKVRDVNQGDTIASIIAGASTCSTGGHLHFEVVKDGTHRDPAPYLKPISPDWNNSPDGPFSFGGNWEWPMHNPSLITQGYGMTYYARVKRYYGGGPHTGIDMISKTRSDLSVVAVKNGALYRGSIACGGGQLRYVKVHHADENIDTYYLHVNY